MTQPDVARLAQALRELVSVISRETASHRLSRTAAGTLAALERHGPSRISDLTRLEAVGQPAMTGLVQRLEASDLVSRTSDPSDRRATLVAVTDAGRDALAERRRQQDAMVAARVARLPPDQLAVLDAAVDAIVELTQEDHDQPH
ncbi:MarR family winged helix-turn-helix transcriptional regulator [Aeromicrobium sp. 50.2.37]|uniref:MarR family winged helix-turn-helix transcriptional regulator n=1 Tax=Aeromicrobium sp. 50.2.37 TaxID=2969305 RepID=UPI00214F61D6|nr:MarR family transcriptional regulator [Aeromicrobium sp. 50.2.37]MCR4511805.1 MarR family transcriptional regulator [Aeromicrobium sp. 50.2.37]